MTFIQAKEQLHALGITLVKKEGEYHVYKKGNSNDNSKYFTDNLDDALATGKAISRY